MSGQQQFSPEAVSQVTQDLITSVTGLIDVLKSETELLRSGRVRDALKLESQKTNSAEMYVRLMRVANENVSALGENDSEDYKVLQEKLGTLTQAVEENVAALVGAKSISDELIENAAGYVNQKIGGASTYTASGSVHVSHAKGTKSVALSKEI